jgi:hypothetical protein
VCVCLCRRMLQETSSIINTGFLCEWVGDLLTCMQFDFFSCFWEDFFLPSG